MFEYLSKVCAPVNCKYGAPTGRHNVGHEPHTVISGNACKILKKNQTKVYDRVLPMSDSCYDKGGVYWGSGPQIRVRFTKDFSFIEYYRTEK